MAGQYSDSRPQGDQEYPVYANITYYRKSRIFRPSQRQALTDIVVNEKPNIDRRYYEKLKAVLTNCERHGLNSQNHFNHTNFRAHLLGCIQHVTSLNEPKGRELENIFEQINH